MVGGEVGGAVEGRRDAEETGEGCVETGGKVDGWGEGDTRREGSCADVRIFMWLVGFTRG
jgi:hypothetical protein